MITMTALVTQFANVLATEFMKKGKALTTKVTETILPKATIKGLPSEGLQIVGMKRSFNGGYTAIDNRMNCRGGTSFSNPIRTSNSDNR